MAIYLKEVKDPSKSFTFPSEPDKQIEVSRATNYQDFNFIGLGKRSYPKGMGAEPIKWNGYFWGKARKGLSSHNTKWKDPLQCIDKLQKWQRKGTQLTLIMGSAELIADCTIKDFNYKPFGGKGDYSYTITLLPYNEIQIYTTDEIGASQNSKKKKKAETNRSSSANARKKTYIVKPGDTLKKISQKKYKTPSKWIAIYNANRPRIEDMARLHGLPSSDKGRLIFPGTVLTIP